tara:strand:+ start:297 stop:470 length:174 start_codon:yes stop_codon:yes gene_type:complete
MDKAFKPKTIAQLNDELNRTSNPVTRSVLSKIIDKRMDAMINEAADKAKVIFKDDWS